MDKTESQDQKIYWKINERGEDTISVNFDSLCAFSVIKVRVKDGYFSKVIVGLGQEKSKTYFKP